MRSSYAAARQGLTDRVEDEADDGAGDLVGVNRRARAPHGPGQDTQKAKAALLQTNEATQGEELVLELVRGIWARRVLADPIRNLHQDDYPLEYYEDGYPKLPNASNRSPSHWVASS